MPDNQKGRANASGEVVEEEDPEVVKERQQKKLQELIEKSVVCLPPIPANLCSARIRYSDNYTDDNYLYRHVTLPKGLLRIVPLSFWSHPDRSGGLRLLSEDECRQIGIQQSNGWEVCIVLPCLLFRN